MVLLIASLSTATADSSCNGLQKLTSKNSDTPTTITFVNHASTMRAILWLDFNGQPQSYAQIEPGKSYTQQTYLTHPWMIATGPGDCLHIVMPRAGGSTIKLTENRAHGGEEGDEQTSCPPGTVPVPETDNCVPAEKQQADCGWYAVYVCGSSKATDGPGFTVKSNEYPGVGAKPYCNIGGPFKTKRDAQTQITRFGGEVRQACR